MKLIDKIAYLLLVVGGINWGLVGLFNFNLVDKLIIDGLNGEFNILANIVYSLVGLSAVYALYSFLTKFK